MNRLQKKCLVVSTGLHTLLLAVVLFGAALMPSEKAQTFTPIKLYNLVTDSPTSGGSPNVTTAPPPAAQPPAPQPQAQAEPQPEPPKAEPIKPVEPVRHKPIEKPTLEPVKKPLLDPKELTLAKRDTVKPSPKKVDHSEEDAAQAAKDAAVARSRLAKQISQNIKGIGNDFSSTAKVDFVANGDSGPAAANYRDIVASKYTAAWNPPANLDDESATVTVSVTIARNGTVTSSRITKPSGNPAMDKSIQTTLDNVTWIEAFPADSKDQERTYSIKFNLAAKRLLG